MLVDVSVKLMTLTQILFLYIKDSVNLKKSRVLVYILFRYEALFGCLNRNGLCGM